MLVLVLRLSVKYVLSFALEKSTTGQACQSRLKRRDLKLCNLFGGLVVMGDDSEEFAVVLTDMPLFGARECYGIFDHSIEHRLKVGRRAGDDPQNFSRRSLLLQGLGEITILSLQLLKQANVFNCNHRL